MHLEQAAEDGLILQTPCYPHIRRPRRISPAPWLYLGPDAAITDIWEVNQQVEVHLCLFYNSAFQLKLIKLYLKN